MSPWHFIPTLATALFFSLGMGAAPDTTVHRYLYAASPGCRDYLQYGGHGVVVFDIDQDHKFVKRIPMKGFAATGLPENVKGIAASAMTKRLYVSTLSYLMAIDLSTDSLLWTKSYNLGCDRMALSPDGKTIYQPSLEQDVWYVLDAATGNERSRISNPGARAHNTIYGPDGKSVYLAGLGSPLLSIAATANATVTGTVGPFSDVIRPFTINGMQSLVYVNVNKLLGFEIGDLQTGKKLHSIKVVGYDTGAVDRHGCPSHGVALTLDESEVWLIDGHNHYVHVFDNMVMPPKQKVSIKTRDFPGWIMFSLDGTLGYPSSGDVIDVKSKQVVGGLFDENGTMFESEKMLEIDFQGGQPIRAGSQFGIGGVSGTVSLAPKSEHRPTQMKKSLIRWNARGERVESEKVKRGRIFVHPYP